MTYEYITSVDAANFTTPEHVPAVFGGNQRRIEFIGLHHWGALGQNFWDVVRYLASANPRQSSAHEVIQDGTVACIVDHSNASWAMANPTGYPNACGLHLELRPEATAGDYATAAERIADLREMHGNVPLRPHNEFTSTACPGAYDLGRLDEMAKAITASRAGTPAPVAPAPAPAPTPPTPPAAIGGRGWSVDPGDTLGGIAGYYGLSVDAIAKANGITDPNRISVGQNLTIPNGGTRTWTVDPGDTLGGIAAYYGVTVDALAAVNGITDPNRISVGQLLQVP